MPPRFFPAWLSSRPHYLLAACLLALHLGLAQGPGNAAGRMVLLAHFGLFLMWQPLVHGGYRFGTRGLLALGAVVAGVGLEASWGVLTLWIMVLASLVAGGAFLESLAMARWTYRLAAGYLILALVLLVLPELLPLPAAEHAVLRRFGVAGPPLLIVVLAALPVPRAKLRPVGAVDLLSALLMFLVLAVLLLGTIAFMALEGRGYLGSLVSAAFGIATILLLLAWVWNPSLGAEGLALKLSRRVLAAGVSFEDWLHIVAQLALAEQEPLAFLSRACATLRRFPGVVGGRGETEGQTFSFGEAESADYPLEQGDLRLLLAFRQAPSAALLWYLSLALQVLHEFHREKVLARRLRTLSYLEAVHQTGARLTHDVKNLLQSLETLCFAASRPEAGAAEVQALMRRQLPVVTQRLAQTLDKLRQPGQVEGVRGPLARWWSDVQERHRGAPVQFVALGLIGAEEIPLTVFHSVVDNLVQNGLDKRASAPGLQIRVELACGPQGVSVAVEDDGAPFPPDSALRLFHEPLASENGFGMGLYQSAALAGQVGCRLELTDNRRGCVRFRLTQAAATGA